MHVAVPSREPAIRVSNRLRPWLPLFLALTANSAVYRNADTGYASWRSIVWARWPSAGPPPHFDSVDEYDAMVRMLHRAGAVLDDGMVYWDVRPSAKFPTIEVRVADVPATVGETVLLATLIRASVMMALDDERRGEPTPPLTPLALKAAYWKSARDGLGGDAHRSTRNPCAGVRAKVVGALGRTRPTSARRRRRLRHGQGRARAASMMQATVRCGSARHGAGGMT